MMNTTTTRGAVVWMVVLLTALLIQPTPPAQAEESQVQGTMIIAPTRTALGVPIGELSGQAPGAAVDTLAACRTRIPELASVGQQLLAEQSCAGEEETRNAIRSAPLFEGIVYLPMMGRGPRHTSTCDGISTRRE